MGYIRSAFRKGCHFFKHIFKSAMSTVLVIDNGAMLQSLVEEQKYKGRYRIAYSKLLTKVSEDLEGGFDHLRFYSPEPPVSFPIVEAIKKTNLCKDIQTFVFQRKDRTCEAKEEDVAINVDIVMMPLLFPDIKRLVIVTGKLRCGDAIASLISSMPTIQIDLWGTDNVNDISGLNDRFRYHSLGDIIDQLGFIRRAWGNFAIPLDRTIVVSFSWIKRDDIRDASTEEDDASTEEDDASTEEGKHVKESSQAAALKNRKSVIGNWMAKYCEDNIGSPISYRWSQRNLNLICRDRQASQLMMIALKEVLERMKLSSWEVLEQYNFKIFGFRCLWEIRKKNGAHTHTHAESACWRADDESDSDDSTNSWTSVGPKTNSKHQSYQIFSEACKYGFRCLNGNKCPYFHHPKERHWFSTNPSPGQITGYKRRFQKHDCKHSGNLHLCPWKHPGEAEIK